MMRRASAKTSVFPVKKSTSRLSRSTPSAPPTNAIILRISLHQFFPKRLYAASGSAAMASNAKSFQKVLDSTALAATKFIRRPPIDPNTPIQGKARVPGSNAFRDHQEKEGRRLQKALNSLTHGKNIFVYQNIRTKQVVYSLTRYLEVSSLFFSMSARLSPEIHRISSRPQVSQFSDIWASRKITSSSNASTTARRPSPPQFARTCGHLTSPSTSTRRKSD